MARLTSLIVILILQISVSFSQKKQETEPVTLNWLDNTPSAAFDGVTWGVPWPQGMVKPDQTFVLSSQEDKHTTLQSWPLAYWPDGSLKWSAHAANKEIAQFQNLVIKTARSSVKKNPDSPLSIDTANNSIVVHTGVTNYEIAKQGSSIIKKIWRNNRTVAQNGQLVMILQNQPDDYNSGNLIQELFKGTIDRATVEQNGPVRAIIMVEGKHQSHNKSLIPFIIRLYFYAGGESMRMMHTIIYNGDETKDFIKGLGVRFEVPMNNEPHNRFIRFAGDNGGIFAEAVKGITGLRRDPGKNNIEAQLNGKATSTINPYVEDRLKYVPAFGDYTLWQPTSEGFEINKRTAEGFGWIKCVNGSKAAGTGYLGSPDGGIGFGIRNFWQSYPGQIDIRRANSDLAELTLWLWAPKSNAMDLRFYHDGMGQNSYASQWDGMEITYEDYEPGYGKPIGVARTSELSFWFTQATPSPFDLSNYAKSVNTPPLLVASPQHFNKTGVFGKIWGLKDTTDTTIAKIEAQLDFNFDYYKLQQKERQWYGFWDYGDIMHTYDFNRHTWRYDVGGFAWDNSELSTDLWLWYYYLHSGRPDVFRMAEAMTRHTGEVDVHHIGPFAPLGSRHNVLHWGCSAKQMRISTAANRRFLYYMTTDERIGDLMNEQINAYKALQSINPMRKRMEKPSLTANNPNLVDMSFGTDWGAVAAAWLTHWERTGDKQMRNKLLTSMQSIATQPKGFFTGSGAMDIQTGAFIQSTDTLASASHLNAVFGLFEICAELNELFSDPSFKKAWIQYCEFYNATSDEQKKELGAPLSKTGLRQAHSRLTAYAAHLKSNETLTSRAITEFYGNKQKTSKTLTETKMINIPEVLYPVHEVQGISTNDAAQWGLSAIQCMYLLNLKPGNK